MFNFSANNLFLLSRTGYQKCAVFLLRDLDTRRVYRLGAMAAWFPATPVREPKGSRESIGGDAESRQKTTFAAVASAPTGIRSII
jgi:hypothetical protein